MEWLGGHLASSKGQPTTVIQHPTVKSGSESPLSLRGCPAFGIDSTILYSGGTERAFSVSFQHPVGLVPQKMFLCLVRTRRGLKGSSVRFSLAGHPTLGREVRCGSHQGSLQRWELPAFFSISIFSLTFLKRQGYSRCHPDLQLQPSMKACCCYVTSYRSIRVHISFSVSHHKAAPDLLPASNEYKAFKDPIGRTVLLNAIRLEHCLRTAFSGRKAASSNSKN